MEEKKNSFISILKGVIIAYIITLILIAVYSIILAYTNLPESTIPTCVVVITFVSVMLSSSLVLKKIKEKGLINGAIIGAIYLITIYILSSIFAVGFSVNTFSIVMLIFSILAGIIGGIVGVNLWLNKYIKYVIKYYIH